MTDQEYDELEARVGELEGVLEEAHKDYCVLQGNIAASEKIDPNWKGVWDELGQRKKMIRTALKGKETE